MNVAVIGDERMVWGFALAGVKETMVTDAADEAENAVRTWSTDSGIGIIMISSGLAAKIRPYLVRTRKEKRLYPLILEIEMPGADQEGGVRVEEELLRAVGMMIRERR